MISQHRPLRQLVKPVALEDYHREPGVVIYPRLFVAQGVVKHALRPRLQLATVRLLKLRIIGKGTDLFFYRCPLLAQSV